jgi:hypothetical protein
MADLIISHEVNDWVKLQLSIYVQHPNWWETGAAVLQQRTGTATTLANDGTGNNVLSMSDTDLTTLINASKPAGYNATTKTLPAGAPIYKYTNVKWNSLIQAAKQDRERVQNAVADPLDPIPEG